MFFNLRLCFSLNFVKTNEECEHLISLAKPNMAKSKVADVKTGRSKDSRFCTRFPLQDASGNFLNFKYQNALMCRVRTSSGAFLKTGHDEIVKEIEDKISDFTFIPVGMWLCFLLVQNMITVYIFGLN